MIDIRLLRTEPEKVKAALARRKENVDIDGLTSGTVVFLTAEKGSSTPDTGDYTNSWMWIAVAGVAVVGIAVLAVCLVRSKKQENN